VRLLGVAAAALVMGPLAVLKPTAMELQTTVRSAESPGRPHTVVELSGEADLNDSAALRDLIAAEAGDQTGTLVLDLSGLRFMDSAVLHVILVAGRAMAARGGTLALASPRDAVRRILTLSGGDKMVPVYDSVAEAERGD
jgi:anti-sigma B factor antagonist